MKKIAFIVLFLCLCLCVKAQVQWRTYSEQIRSLYSERMWLILSEDGVLNGEDEQNTLHISFDEMSHDVHQYTYTVRHMNADWSKESDLLSSEYVSGFTTMDIYDYEHSVNTNRSYTHYWFSFPNADMVLTKSGNYRLLIYEDGNPDNKVAEVDFCVAEPIAKIEGKVRANTDIEYNGRYQQLDFNVTIAPSAFSFQPSEISVLVMQNNREDNAVWVKPTFIEPTRLQYINNKALIFEGGNEYRTFDAYSNYYAGTNVDRMVYEMGDYHALLFPDELMTDQYIHRYDENGRFKINAEHVQDDAVEAEYVWVHWTLPVEKPWLDGAVYVGGDLFNNEMGLRNRMQYDVEAKCYWLTALVKQGGYSYQYWFTGKGTKNQTTTQRIDGSYWQTRNEYSVLVYWRPFGARYDRLVGVSLIQ